MRVHAHCLNKHMCEAPARSEFELRSSYEDVHAELQSRLTTGPFLRIQDPCKQCPRRSPHTDHHSYIHLVGNTYDH